MNGTDQTGKRTRASRYAAIAALAAAMTAGSGHMSCAARADKHTHGWLGHPDCPRGSHLKGGWNPNADCVKDSPPPVKHWISPGSV